MPSLLLNLMALAWDFGSADLLSNRMVAACGLPPTLREVPTFISRYPQMHSHLIETKGGPAVFVVDDDDSVRAAIQDMKFDAAELLTTKRFGGQLAVLQWSSHTKV